jgi:hypothetical protein
MAHAHQGRPGTDVMIIKIPSLKNSAKKLAFLTQNYWVLTIGLIVNWEPFVMIKSGLANGRKHGYEFS